MPSLPEKYGPGTALLVCCVGCRWDMENAGVHPEVWEWCGGPCRTNVAADKGWTVEEEKSERNQTLLFLGLVKKSVNC